MTPTIPPGNSAEEVRETRHPSLRGASRSPSVAFWGGRDVADDAIDDDDAVRPKNVPWNWPMPSIGTTGEEGARGRQRRRALRSDDGTILDRGRGHGRFSRPDGGDAEEDRGSDGNNGTPDDRGSGEERDDGSAPPATAVNPLDSAKHAFWRQLEGEGWRNNATATDDDGNDSGVVEERYRTGEGRSLTRPGGRSTRPPVVAYRHRRTGSG